MATRPRSAQRSAGDHLNRTTRLQLWHGLDIYKTLAAHGYPLRRSTALPRMRLA